MSTHAVDMTELAPLTERRSVVRRVWLAVSAAFAAFLGVLPHVLHHAGPLAGAALVAGAGGSILFAGVGFVVAIPFLVRVRRRCGDWRVPAGLLAAMAVTFSLSTFVIGPAIVDDDKPSPASKAQPARGEPAGHDAHH